MGFPILVKWHIYIESAPSSVTCICVTWSQWVGPFQIQSVTWYLNKWWFIRTNKQVQCINDLNLLLFHLWKCIGGCLNEDAVKLYIDGFVQNCSNSSALAMELLQSCTEPSIYTCIGINIMNIRLLSYLPSWYKLDPYHWKDGLYETALSRKDGLYETVLWKLPSSDFPAIHNLGRCDKLTQCGLIMPYIYIWHHGT